MKIYVILLAILSTTCVLACSTQPAKTLTSPSQSQSKTTTTPDATIQKMLDEKVVVFYKWKIDSKLTLFCILRDIGKPEFPGEPTSTFSIVDEKGRELYKLDNVDIRSISTLFVLRDVKPQLVVDANWGGRENSLKILDYQTGTIVELLDKEDHDYSVYAFIKPQFRTGVNPSEEPYEVFLTRGIGLPSPDEKRVNVYRYSGKSYEIKGELPQKHLDNYIEQLIKKSTR